MRKRTKWLIWVGTMLLCLVIWDTKAQVVSQAKTARTATAGQTALPQQRLTQPNIIFILADDLGQAELGCYANRFNQTPNIDRLARGGMRFTQAYAAAPVCSPTRAALMSGQSPARLRITDYLGPQEPDKFLDPAMTTLNEVLKTKGYVSGLVGKWHLTGDYTLKRGEPAKHGWDEIICSETTYIGNGDYWSPYKHLQNTEARQPDEYLIDRLNTEAVNFIERHQQEPFFLYLSHYAIHTKLDGKPDKTARYAAKPGASERHNNPKLAAMLESVDQGVEQIVETLERLKLDKNTIIVFTSDNGGETRVTLNGVLREGKSYLYEGGIRIPLVVWWPGVIAGGSESSLPVVTQDFFPTLIAVAGGTLPKGQVCDGMNLLPVLKGAQNLERTNLYWHYPLPKPHFLGGTSAGAVRSGNYKLIEFFDTGISELYDLSDDQGEQRNLAAQFPEKATELRRTLEAWRQQVKAEEIPRIFVK